MKKITFIRLILLCINLCCFITLTACGFHPGGEIPLAPPFHRLYLKSDDPYGPLSHIITQKLKSYGVCFVSNPEAANLILHIIGEDPHQQLLSVGATQQTRQYNLILTVTYQVTDTRGHVLVPPQTVNEIRTIPIHTNQILAGSNEANNLYAQMRPAIASDIINRLASEDVTHLVMMCRP